MLNNLNNLKNKKYFKMFIVFFIFCIILNFPDFNKFSSLNIKDKYLSIKNRKFNTYLKNNENKILSSCLNEESSIQYYNHLYKSIIRIIYNLNKNNIISKNEMKEIFKLLKFNNFYLLYDKVNSLDLKIVNIYTISKKKFLISMVNDLLFYPYDVVEKSYIDTIKTDKFNLDYYKQISNFYKKNCEYDKAIELLLKVSSIVTNNSQDNINIYEIYIELGDLFYKKRDYKNSLINFTNAFVNLDFNGMTSKKIYILIKLGDIMSIFGNNFETINYYKYALSLNKRTLKKEEYIELLLKLSRAYYTYGNYENGLKFSKKAEKMSKKLKNKLFISKSTYEECLNYEYLREYDKAKKACEIAKDNAEQYKNENNNFESYVNLATMLDYSSYLKNKDLAKEYLNIANNLIKSDRDIYKKIWIMEKIAYINSYSNNEDKVVALQKFQELDALYKIFNIKIGCCNSLLSGFISENINADNVEEYYLRAENELENRKQQLSTLYSYMADYYVSINKIDKAIYCAKKSLILSKQIYKYNHHYISYIKNQLERIKNLEK